MFTGEAAMVGSTAPFACLLLQGSSPIPVCKVGARLTAELRENARAQHRSQVSSQPVEAALRSTSGTLREVSRRPEVLATQFLPQMVKTHDDGLASSSNMRDRDRARGPDLLWRNATCACVHHACSALHVMPPRHLARVSPHLHMLIEQGASLRSLGIPVSVR